MRFSFILAIVAFIASIVLTNLEIPSLAGAEMLTFLLAIFTGFIGVINSGTEADSSIKNN